MLHKQILDQTPHFAHFRAATCAMNHMGPRSAKTSGWSISGLFDPPAFVLKPQSKRSHLNKFSKYGRLFRCYDLI